MNRFVNRFALAVFALTLMWGQADAQFTTTFAKNASPGQQNGLYYSLPQTMLQLDFVIRETVCEPGPLSDYADMYFENEDYVDYQTTTYELLDVQMTSKAAPDPNATFFVTFTSSRGGGKTFFDVLPNGIIRSVGVLGDKEENMADNETLTVESVSSETAFSSGKGFMPLMTSGKSNAQLAKEAVDKIEEIRKAKFYLISGDVEMASNPETFNDMYTKLVEAEQQYLSLFLGNRITREVVRTIYVIPNKETPTQTVAKFSESDGLTSGTSGMGASIVVQTLPLNNTAIINAPSQSAVESMAYENKVMYRIPETANVKVSFGNRTLIEERQTVNQLGVIVMAPVMNSKLYFDTETGQIVNIRMQ